MEEGNNSGVGGGDSSSAATLGRAASSCVKVADRQAFTVELRPGETTFVSWKKLIKDASSSSNNNNKSSNNQNKLKSNNNNIESNCNFSNNSNGEKNNNNNNQGSAAVHTSATSDTHHNLLESRLAPGQKPVDNGVEKDAPAPNRFNAVIEKIERLYMGKDSSDDEDLDDVPDDDQYDTEDSFIDDTELNEYFEVDHSALKHDGFFVNRGQLERVNEPTAAPEQQPKKRRRKDVSKPPGESNDGRIPNKQVKLGKSAAAKQTMPNISNASYLATNMGSKSELYGELKSQNLSAGSENCSTKKYADGRLYTNPSPSVKAPNGDPSMFIADAKYIDKPNTGSLPAKNLHKKLKDASGPLTHLKDQDRSAKSQNARPVNRIDDFEPSVHTKEKNGAHGLPDLNLPQTKVPMEATKNSNTLKKDGTSARSRVSMLEKAIRELEKVVVESKPHAGEMQEGDIASQAIKRRLPREIKLKLAKVARLAQASQGKISKELLSRLMSILGNSIQLRTLKRNLKVMISTSLSAKQEKDNRFQQIKEEVVQMIKTRVPALESKALGLKSRSADDFQDIGSEEQAAIKKKFSMDAVLEDKICDLYDLFVDGLDEDAGPQVRKLYLELAQLWPSGFMDNHGIKRAICRSKERRRAIYNRSKDQEKIKRRKMLAPKVDEMGRVETAPVAQGQQLIRDKSATDSSAPVLALASKLIPSLMDSSSMERLKQEKPKASASDLFSEAKILPSDNVVKNKVKRKPEQDLGETHFRSDHVHLGSSEDRKKLVKMNNSSFEQ